MPSQLCKYIGFEVRIIGRAALCLLWSLLMAIIIITSAWGMDYYISSSKGSDQNSGLSADQPWKTMNKVKNLVVKPGDRILLKRGDVWRENLAIAGSGSESGPLEISAYGDGPKPVLNGSIALSGWQSHSQGIYRIEYRGTCQGLLEDGKPIRKASGWDLLDGGWYHDGHQIYYKPGWGTPTEHLIECCSKPGLSILSRNGVSVADIAVYGCGASGIWVINSSRLQIRDCVITANAGYGIGIVNRPNKPGTPCSEISIEKNTISWNSNGIYLIWEPGAPGLEKIRVVGNLVEYNDFQEVWGKTDGHGLGVQNTSNSYFAENEFRYNRTGPCFWTAPDRRSDHNVFTRNFVHHNQKYGVVFGGEGHDNMAGNSICFNIITDNGTEAGMKYGGLRINRRQSDRNEFTNNTLARNDINIFLNTLSDYAVIKRNISYNPKFYHVLIEDNQPKQYVFEENLYYPDGAGFFGVGTKRMNFPAWRTKIGQEAGSLVQNPLFISASPSSPADFTPAESSLTLRPSKVRQLPPPPKWVKIVGGSARSPEMKFKGPTKSKYLEVDYFGKSLGSEPFFGAIKGHP